MPPSGLRSTAEADRVQDRTINRERVIFRKMVNSAIDIEHNNVKQVFCVNAATCREAAAHQRNQGFYARVSSGDRPCGRQAA